MNYFLLINVKIPINCWHFNIFEQEHKILDLSDPEKAEFLDFLYL